MKLAVFTGIVYGELDIFDEAKRFENHNEFCRKQFRFSGVNPTALYPYAIPFDLRNGIWESSPDLKMCVWERTLNIPSHDSHLSHQ